MWYLEIRTRIVFTIKLLHELTCFDTMSRPTGSSSKRRKVSHFPDESPTVNNDQTQPQRAGSRFSNFFASLGWPKPQDDEAAQRDQPGSQQQSPVPTAPTQTYSNETVHDQRAVPTRARRPSQAPSSQAHQSRVPPFTEPHSELRHKDQNILPPLSDLVHPPITLAEYGDFAAHEQDQTDTLNGLSIGELKACGAWEIDNARPAMLLMASRFMNCSRGRNEFLRR